MFRRAPQVHFTHRSWFQDDRWCGGTWSRPCSWYKDSQAEEPAPCTHRCLQVQEKSKLLQSWVLKIKDWDLLQLFESVRPFLHASKQTSPQKTCWAILKLARQNQATLTEAVESIPAEPEALVARAAEGTLAVPTCVVAAAVIRVALIHICDRNKWFWHSSFAVWPLQSAGASPQKPSATLMPRLLWVSSLYIPHADPGLTGVQGVVIHTSLAWVVELTGTRGQSQSSSRVHFMWHWPLIGKQAPTFACNPGFRDFVIYFYLCKTCGSCRVSSRKYRCIRSCRQCSCSPAGSQTVPERTRPHLSGKWKSETTERGCLRTSNKKTIEHMSSRRVLVSAAAINFPFWSHPRKSFWCGHLNPHWDVIGSLQGDDHCLKNLQWSTQITKNPAEKLLIPPEHFVAKFGEGWGGVIESLNLLQVQSQGCSMSKAWVAEIGWAQCNLCRIRTPSLTCSSRSRRTCRSCGSCWSCGSCRTNWTCDAGQTSWPLGAWNTILAGRTSQTRRTCRSCDTWYPCRKKPSYSLIFVQFDSVTPLSIQTVVAAHETPRSQASESVFNKQLEL